MKQNPVQRAQGQDTASVWSRREALKAAGIAAILAGLPARELLAQPATPAAPARALRIAHLTDLHIQPEKRAQVGVVQCLHHMQERAKPDLVLTGGDLVMDTWGTPIERSRELWKILTGTFKNDCSIPVHHAMGNHDNFGHDKKNSKATGEEPYFGKRLFLDSLGVEKTYHSFSQAGWRFIMLDSITPDGTGYLGRLDEAQAAWLDGLLAADTTTPTLVVSHIPIIGLTMQTEDKASKSIKSPWSRVHADGLALHKKFVKAGNIRLCLSGHIHLHDRIELGVAGAPFDGPKVTYLCDGAVCGSWWDGRKNNCDEGYGVVDLFPDGRFEHHYETYGWKAE